MQFKCNFSAFRDFSDISNNPEDTLVEELHLDSASDEEEIGAVGDVEGGAEQQQQLQQPQVCCVCLSNAAKILLLQCGHYILCEICFKTMRNEAKRERWVSTVLVPPNVVDPITYTVDDDEEEDNDLFDDASIQYNVRCPKCRTTNASVTDIVNRKIYF